MWIYLKYLYLHIFFHYKVRSSIMIDKQSLGLNVMSVHLSAFVDIVNIFIRYRSRHLISEISVMVTEMVSTSVFSCKKNHSCGMKISINFINVCSKSTLYILNKFDTGFFSCCSLTRFFNTA